MGGPGLTTAAFDQGVRNLQTTLETNAENQPAFERNKSSRSFADKHGDSLARHLSCLTGVADDDHLPESHQLLAKSTSKHRDCGTLNHLLVQRAATSNVPLTCASAPTVTSKLVDEVWQSFVVSGTGPVFAQGLSP